MGGAQSLFLQDMSIKRWELRRPLQRLLLQAGLFDPWLDDLWACLFLGHCPWSLGRNRPQEPLDPPTLSGDQANDYFQYSLKDSPANSTLAKVTVIRRQSSKFWGAEDSCALSAHVQQV